MASQNGPHGTDNGEDQFEKDLKDMLRDGPSLNDLSSPIQGGSGSNGTSTGTVQGIPRSHSLPPATMAVDQNPDSGSRPRPAILGLDPVPAANSSIPLASPEHGANRSTAQNAFNKLESFKAWSMNTYKCTRQVLSEKFGKGARTVDLELEAQIEALRDTQRKYSNILRLARALSSHFTNVVSTQRQLGDAFSEMAQRNPELQEEFTYNAETQKTLHKNGETLLAALNFFTSSVSTLCNKTMDDTILTIKNFEHARVEFDAYKTDLDALQTGPRDAGTSWKIEESKRKFEAHKEKYEKLRGDVQIKLRFLDENKVKVMHKQLLLFHNAVSSYFSGNQSALEATLKQFNIKLKPPNSGDGSWLEK